MLDLDCVNPELKSMFVYLTEKLNSKNKIHSVQRLCTDTSLKLVKPSSTTSNLDKDDDENEIVDYIEL